MNRNRFITYSAAYASAAAMLPRRALSASESSYAVLDRIVPTETDADRIAQITVCLRPFRAQGPRVEAEHVGDKLVVHMWTPDSRVALESDTTAAFANTWERMARTSFAMYQSYLGVAVRQLNGTTGISSRGHPRLRRCTFRKTGSPRSCRLRRPYCGHHARLARPSNARWARRWA